MSVDSPSSRNNPLNRRNYLASSNIQRNPSSHPSTEILSLQLESHDLRTGTARFAQFHRTVAKRSHIFTPGSCAGRLGTRRTGESEPERVNFKGKLAAQIPADCDDDRAQREQKSFSSTNQEREEDCCQNTCHAPPCD